MKALRVAPDTDVSAAMAAYPTARGLLLDTWQADSQGGTGAVFDWSLVPGNAPQPLVLAGGLNPDNVGAAVHQLRPYAVDVSSGVESAPGRKSAALVRAFTAAVTGADRALEEMQDD